MIHKKLFTILSVSLLFGTSLSQQIDIKSTESFSPYIFGHNLEHTRSAVSGGLSAQMLQNRKFVGKAYGSVGLTLGWFPIGDKVFFQSRDNTETLVSAGANNSERNDIENRSYTAHFPMKKGMFRRNELHNQIIDNMSAGEIAGMGQNGLYIQKGVVYQLRTVTRVVVPVSLKVDITDKSGTTVYCSNIIKLAPGKDWQIAEFDMTPSETDSDATIRYTFTEQARLIIGALSMMPKDNFHGMRKDVVANLKAMRPKLLRWPGGNFAGEYRWKDGILPVDQRGPMGTVLLETQQQSFGYDFHEIGTDDFIALCRKVGAEPCITINAVWTTPEENAEWVEYCNGSIDTEYGKKRAENGHPEPYNVRFWSLGNEMGFDHMEGPKSSSAYGEMAGAHAEAMLKIDPDLEFLSSGPYPNDDWAKNSAAKIADKAKYVSQHIYVGCKDYVYIDSASIRKTYEEMMGLVPRVNNGLNRMRECLNATGEKLHISFDEWNVWYAWHRPSCVAEGIFTAKILHMLMAKSNTLDIPISCYFQPIGEGAIVIDQLSSRLTANGQMFALLTEHANGKICKITDNDDFSTIATIKDGILTITLINSEYSKDRKFLFSNIKGKIVSSTLYYNDDVRPLTYFNSKALEVSCSKGNITTTLPPHSVSMIQIKLEKQ